MTPNDTLTVFHHPFDLQIDRLFNDAFRSVGGFTSAPRIPCNVYEDDNEFRVEMALPGMTAKDIDIAVDDGVLTVNVERTRIAPESDDARYYVRELDWGMMSRGIKLPSYVDHAKSSASFKDGILTITFPKLEEAKPRRIMIEAK